MNHCSLLRQHSGTEICVFLSSFDPAQSGSPVSAVLFCVWFALFFFFVLESQQHHHHKNGCIYIKKKKEGTGKQATDLHFSCWFVCCCSFFLLLLFTMDALGENECTPATVYFNFNFFFRLCCVERETHYYSTVYSI
jgi:hypothetical protein